MTGLPGTMSAASPPSIGCPIEVTMRLCSKSSKPTLRSISQVLSGGSRVRSMEPREACPLAEWVVEDVSGVVVGYIHSKRIWDATIYRLTRCRDVSACTNAHRNWWTSSDPGTSRETSPGCGPGAAAGTGCSSQGFQRERSNWVASIREYNTSMQKTVPGRPGKGQRKSYLGTTAEGLKGEQPIPDTRSKELQKRQRPWVKSG